MMERAGRRWRIPWFTFAQTAVVATVATAGMWHGLHARFADALSLNWHDLVAFQFYRLFTGTFVQTRAFLDWTILFLLLTFVPPYEVLRGWRRTALIFFLGDAISSAGAVVFFRLLGALGNATALRWALEQDSGASSGCFAALGGLAVAAPRRWRPGVVLLGIGIHAFRLWFRGHEADYQHLAAWLVGIGLALAMERLWPPRIATNR